MWNPAAKRFRSRWLTMFVILVVAIFMVQNRTFLLNSIDLRSGILSDDESHYREIESPSAKCSEQRHVAFVKVHKAASTTITTILQRFGYSRNLTFALPRDGPFNIGLFDTFHPRNVMPIRPGAEYEILCQHVVYNKEAFQKYFPPDTQVISAVREPVSHFMSTFLFFPEYIPAAKKDLPKAGQDNLSLMKHFLSNPEFYEPDNFEKGSLAINRQSFDLGLPREQNKNSTYVKEYIKKLDKEMTFVAISEYFDESLVILKRRLCWSIKDILFKVQHKGSRKKPNFSEDMVLRLREVQPADFAIYEYFLEKYKQIALTEPKLKEEVEFFQTCLKEVHSYCQNVKLSPNTILAIEKSEFSDSFTINRYDCDLLNMSEKQAVHKLIQKQKPKK